MIPTNEQIALARKLDAAFLIAALDVRKTKNTRTNSGLTPALAIALQLMPDASNYVKASIRNRARKIENWHKPPLCPFWIPVGLPFDYLIILLVGVVIGFAAGALYLVR